ncbi:hypothetical protein ACWGIN_31675 [Streptomyces sp. NPDC054861]
MAKGPLSHGKTFEEVAREVRVFLLRIKRRRQRFESVQSKLLVEARRYVVEAVAAGVPVEEVAPLVGYKAETVARWAAKNRSPVRSIPCDAARSQLDHVRHRRQRVTAEESRIAGKTRSIVRKSVEMGINAEEFTDLTGYTPKTVTRWYAAANKSLEQTRRQRELASIRRSKRNRPPQHLSPRAAQQWLEREQERRLRVLEAHGLKAGISSSPAPAVVPVSRLRKPSIRAVKRRR